MQKTPPKTNGFWISFCVQELHPNSRRNRELTYFYSRCRCIAIASCAAAAMLTVQVTLNTLGSVDLLPLTGVTFPFVSMGI